MVNSLQRYNNNVNRLFNTTDYDDLEVAPNPLQNRSARSARRLSTPNAYDEAEGIASGVASADPASILDRDIGAYMNPYLEDVRARALADFDRQAAESRAASAAQLAGSGSFGSRRAIYDAANDDRIRDSRADLSTRLLSDGFDRAMGYAEADTARAYDADSRRLAAAGLLGQLGTSRANTEMGQIALQNDIGNQRYEIDARNQFAPYNYMSLYGDLLGKGQFDLFRGADTEGEGTLQGTTVTKSSPGLLNVGLGLASLFKPLGGK